MMYWENNPNGVCEDAPCCGCCGPQGDGRESYPDPYPDEDAFHNGYWDDEPMCVECGAEMDEGYEHGTPGPDHCFDCYLYRDA